MVAEFYLSCFFLMNIFTGPLLEGSGSPHFLGVSSHKIGLGLKKKNYFLMLILSCSKFKNQFYWIFLATYFFEFCILMCHSWKMINFKYASLICCFQDPCLDFETWPAPHKWNGQHIGSYLTIKCHCSKWPQWSHPAWHSCPTLVLVQSGKLFMVSAALEEPHYFSSQILLKKNPK